MDILKNLNDEQVTAVLTTEGPLLILAGAGSGKTRVLTHRIAYLIEECGLPPWNILAITFTNKAAQEMRERVNGLLSRGADQVWVSTFHALCVRILRRFADKIGYERNFTIYDTDDSKTLMKNICKKLNIDTKIYKEKMFLGKISSAKDELIDSVTFERDANAGGDDTEILTARVYREYQSELKKNNAFDFDDLIVKTVQLLNEDERVLDYYQERFRYIMVDEYQDTNTAQFKLISTLAERYRNLCVVGDDDQSIYKFRGANIRNILDFEKTYTDAKVIKLEENYRSTGNILDAANGVIKHNYGRKQKALWTEKDSGAKVVIRQFNSEYEEASGIVGEIWDETRYRADYKDFAILYRTNAQSRILEEKLVLKGIPYRIIGGHNFYERREIKDVLAYLKLIDNSSDEIALRRVINVPRRGIGQTTIEKAAVLADIREVNLFDLICDKEAVRTIGKTGAKLNEFAELILEFRSRLSKIPLADLYDNILTKTGYLEELQEEGTDEAENRIENLDELRNKIIVYEETAAKEHEKDPDKPAPGLTGFLAEVSLVADVDDLEESENRVVLMTLHSAKGLEFPYVYITGMEDGLFPSYRAIMGDDPDEVEEERRLCYVGITRAMKKLTLTWSRTRTVQGRSQINDVSRFLKEIPPELVNGYVEPDKRQSYFGSTGKTGYYGNTKPQQGGYYGGPNRQSGNNGSYFTSQKQPYGMKKKSVFGKDPLNMPGIMKGSDFMKKFSADLKVGDRVKHQKFGEGTVVGFDKSGDEREIHVDFDRKGLVRMRLNVVNLIRL